MTITGHQIQEILDQEPSIPYERIRKVHKEATISTKDNETSLGVVYLLGFICGTMAERKGMASNQVG